MGEARRTGRDSAAEEEEARRLGEELARAEAELREVEAERDEPAAGLPNLAEDEAPDGGEDDALELRRVGEPPSFGFTPARPRGDRAGRGEHRPGGGRARLGRALRLPAGAAGAGAARPGRPRHGPPRGPGLHPRRAARAGARGGDVGDRLLPDRPGLDLPHGRGRPLPGGHLRGAAGGPARRPDPRRGRPAPALRAAVHLLPPRGRRRRQGHPRHLPRAPVRQGRDVLVRAARRSRAPSTGASWAPGGDPAGARGPLPGGGHRGRRPRRAGGAEVRLRGLVAGAGRVPRADLVLQLHRLPGSPPALPGAPGQGHRDAPHAERHGHGRGAHAHRHPRERPARGRLGGDARRAPGARARPRRSARGERAGPVRASRWSATSSGSPTGTG